MFQLHLRLEQDCEQLGRFSLCRLLLMRDANYPWCILVPERAGVSEIYQLSREDQLQLTRESAQLAGTMARLFAADKMNIAALGNVVPQLHIHHIARHRNDPAWPAPVWGSAPPRAYLPDELARTVASLRAAFEGELQAI